jgi:hypothetical protein
VSFAGVREMNCLRRDDAMNGDPPDGVTGVSIRGAAAAAILGGRAVGGRAISCMNRCSAEPTSSPVSWELVELE